MSTTTSSGIDFTAENEKARRLAHLREVRGNTTTDTIEKMETKNSKLTAELAALKGSPSKHGHSQGTVRGKFRSLGEEANHSIETGHISYENPDDTQNINTEEPIVFTPIGDVEAGEEIDFTPVDDADGELALIPLDKTIASKPSTNGKTSTIIATPISHVAKLGAKTVAANAIDPIDELMQMAVKSLMKVSEENYKPENAKALFQTKPMTMEDGADLAVAAAKRLAIPMQLLADSFGMVAGVQKRPGSTEKGKESTVFILHMSGEDYKQLSTTLHSCVSHMPSVRNAIVGWAHNKIDIEVKTRDKQTGEMVVETKKINTTPGELGEHPSNTRAITVEVPNDKIAEFVPQFSKIVGKIVGNHEDFLEVLRLNQMGEHHLTDYKDKTYATRTSLEMNKDGMMNFKVETNNPKVLRILQAVSKNPNYYIEVTQDPNKNGVKNCRNEEEFKGRHEMRATVRGLNRAASEQLFLLVNELTRETDTYKRLEELKRAEKALENEQKLQAEREADMLYKEQLRNDAIVNHEAAVTAVSEGLQRVNDLTIALAEQHASAQNATKGWDEYSQRVDRPKVHIAQAPSPTTAGYIQKAKDNKMAAATAERTVVP